MKHLTLKVPEKLQLYGLYVYYVVHICDFGMLRVNLECLRPHFSDHMFKLFKARLTCTCNERRWRSMGHNAIQNNLTKYKNKTYSMLKVEETQTPFLSVRTRIIDPTPPTAKTCKNK